MSGLRRAVYDAPLRRGLARRFSVIGGDGGFEVAVNGDPIGDADRGYRESLQYVWRFGVNGAGPRRSAPQEFSEDASVVLDGGAVPLRGWIGTAHMPGQLVDAVTGESMNRIVVMARGREVQEDMLGDLAPGGAWRGCVAGEIRADFLDADDEDDIVAPGRRWIVGDAPRYEALRAAVKGALDAVEQKWNGLRDKDGPRRAREVPEIGRWYGALGHDHRRMADSFFGRINRIPIDDEGDRRRLLIGSALAFESLGLGDALDRLGRVDEGGGGGEGPDALRGALARIDDFDASAYYQAAKCRLGAIDRLVDAADGRRLEGIACGRLLDRPWLLDPSWERAAGADRMEAGMDRELEAMAASENGRGWVQCTKYRSAAGRHAVICLKRQGVRIGTGDVIAHIARHDAAVRRVLDKAGRGCEPVEFVCVVDEDLADWDDPESRDRSQRALAGYSARVVKCGELVGRPGRRTARTPRAGRVCRGCTILSRGSARRIGG